MLKFYSHRDEAGMATLFQKYYGYERVNDPDLADIIIWNGGADIGTSIYGERPVSPGIPYEPSIRDKEEMALFDKFKDNVDKLLIGVCRGGQLLNVLNGGKLYQHVDGHSGNHEMLDIRTGETFYVTSTHHQQFKPNLDTAVIVGLSSESSFKYDSDGRKLFDKAAQLKDGVDVEIVWYPGTRSLCVQGHPEYVPGTKFSDYTLSLIREFYPRARAA